ncbi:MAG: NAD(P)-dependent oxidoreductase [Candidatus Rokuibacteriota bacterium]|nr:MAG: NAD(P)-dependent oxidoreductase [Candidatus Rokubacteria bacterium]
MGVLITGGMGVLGSMVTEELVSRGERVVLYARHFDRSLLAPDVLGAVEFVRGDVLDLPNVVHAIRRHRTDRILHMAALLIGECQENPYLGFRVNAGGAVNVYEAARMTDVGRVVYTSSKSVYGAVAPPYGHPTYAPLPEEGPKNPVRVYDVTKLAGEQMGLNYATTFGLDLVILRFASTFGPGKLVRHGPVSWHSRLVENAMAGSPGRLPQGGDQPDDMIYHRDIAHAIVLACYATGLEHRIFNIGRGEASTMRQFAHAIRRVVPGAVLEVGPGLDYYGSGIPYYSVYDITRARTELGFQSRFDLEAGVRDYITTMERLGIPPTVIP